MPTYLEAFRAARSASQQHGESSSPGPAEPPQNSKKPTTTEPVATPATLPPPPAPIATEETGPAQRTNTKADKSKIAPVTPTRKTPVKAAKVTPTKPKLEIGKQKGLYDTKNVRTKIAKWQALEDGGEASGEDVGGSAPPEEVLVVDVPPKSPAVGKGKAASPKKEAASPKAPPSPKKDNDKAGDLPDGIRHFVTPKKRVVSDEHWKKNHMPAPIKLPSAIEEQLREALVQKGLYAAGGSKNPEGWIRKKKSPVKKPDTTIKVPTPAGATSKKTIDKWAANIDDPPDGQERDIDDVSPNIMRAKKPEPLSTPKKKDAKPTPKQTPPYAAIRKTPPKKRPTRAIDHESPEDDLGDDQPRPAINPMMARMQAWIMDTDDDPFVEDLDEDDAELDRDLPRQGLGSMLAPRATGVRHREHRSGQTHRSRSGQHCTTDHTQTGSDGYSSSTSDIKRSGANRVYHRSPTATSNTGDSVAVEPGWQITGRSSTSSHSHDLAVQLAPVPSHDNTRQVHLKEAALRPALKRKTTSEADLMSVLSHAEAREPSRNARARMNRPNHNTVDGLLADFLRDESRYVEELKILVDGVVPVLLNHIMSDSGASTNRLPAKKSAGLSRSKDTVVNLGIALERLQALHRQLSKEDSKQIINWARRAETVYRGYVEAWRLGFQGILVNLAPGDGKQQGIIEAAGLKALGDEQADVTSLLKRPLARLKYLHRLAQGLGNLGPSKDTSNLVSNYQSLLDDARAKQDQERARIEDEAAAAIDTARARDPLTLAPLSSVTIRADLGVRARDVFDLHMHHSSGQRIDCRVALYLRDDDGAGDRQGDVLFCQQEESSKWLLLPPAELRNLSARRGTSNRELVVMLRGKMANGQPWHELISLTSNSETTAADWIQLLGLQPVPPRHAQRKRSTDDDAASVAGTCLMSVAGTEIPVSEVEIPLGEHSVIADARPRNPRVEAWVHANLDRDDREDLSQYLNGPRTLPSDHASTLDSATAFGLKDDRKVRFLPVTEKYTARAKNNLRNFFSDLQASVTPPPKYEIRRSRQSKRDDQPRPRSLPRYPPSLLPEDEYDDDDSEMLSEMTPVAAVAPRKQASESRPIDQQSSRPPVRRPLSTIFSEIVPQDTKTSLSDGDQARTPPRNDGLSKNDAPSTALPLSRQRYRHDRSPSSPTVGSLPQGASSLGPSQPPPRPQQQTPNLQPKALPSNSGIRRRSSSPLKHEYQPSSPSEASYGIDDLGFDDEDSISSVSSIDGPPIPPKQDDDLDKHFPTRSRPSSTYSPTGAGTLGPSESASQTPFRSVPREAAPKDANRVIASIFGWSNKGIWESLHPDECSVIVSPGLIEAYKMTAAHSVRKDPRTGKVISDTGPDSDQPLLAVELTPLVPLRQGTAIDISIRSPPTSNSLIRTGNNLMFRSRSGAECDVLYQLINQARINNPTYIALQSARPKLGGGWGKYMDQQASQRESKSWWHMGSKKSSYRASSGRGKTASVAETRSSIASSFSAMSALKRFSGGNKAFNVAKSTITSGAGRSNRNSRSTWTSSSGGSGSGPGPGYGMPARAIDPAMGSPAGITDLKIRLYEREVASKWKDMGRARLTILHPPRHTSASTAAMISPTGAMRLEKRVLVTGKTKGEMLLDKTLGETAFERVARTGIAVMFGEQYDAVQDTGGVMSARNRVFMIQMKSEAEAAYVFSLVGRPRY